jgi:hypothetical protein
MDEQCGRADKIPLEQMLREVNECISGKNQKIWSQMTSASVAKIGSSGHK